MLGGHQFEDALPETMSVGHNVALVAHQDSFAAVIAGVVEGVADDALYSLARVHVFLHRNFVFGSLLENATHVAVEPFGVLANHGKIHVCGLHALERTQSGVEQSDGTNVGVKVHLEAHAQQDFFGMNV